MNLKRSEFESAVEATRTKHSICWETDHLEAAAESLLKEVGVKVEQRPREVLPPRLERAGAMIHKELGEVMDRQWATAGTGLEGGSQPFLRPASTDGSDHILDLTVWGQLEGSGKKSRVRLSLLLYYLAELHNQRLRDEVPF